ncbi:MAG TPA: NADH-quinone oxidoreductase subunit N [Anaerolineales bacterium]|nr:NADH-quinone oxidoreductase subunit N [Anaerolineales bacterium]
MFASVAFLSILPESLILILGVILLIVEPFLKEPRRRDLGWLTAGGMLVILIVSILAGRPADPTSTFGNTIRFDWLGFFFEMLFVFGAGMTALLLMDHEKVGGRGEAYVLLLASTIGMCLMASAADLIMLYLAIETTSIPLYVLAGFLLADDRSTESGFKYLLFGAMTSAIMLYGFSLLYGFAGTTNLYALADVIKAGQIAPGVIFGVIVLLIVGLSFKVSVVPFHFWAPDVYEGAPTPVSGFLSTASKAAGFAVIARLFLVAFPHFTVDWTAAFAVLSAVTMTVGNLLALPQKNLKRMLAYSSIAHAGYAMIGIVAYSQAQSGLHNPQLGIASVVFYMAAYIVTNLAAFGVVMAVGRVVGSDDYDAYRGLSRRSPLLGLIMLAAFLSLAGMPPFAGFVAKVVVFAAGIQSGYVWLVIIGILNSIVGVYYYLNVIKYVYLYRLEGEDEEKHPVTLTRPYAVALIVLVLGIILIGTVFAPWYSYSNAAALNLF